MYNYDDPTELLEAICYRELTKFTASATIDVNDRESDVAGPQASLFGGGREYAKNVLTSRIQKAIDEARLGIEVVLLGLQSFLRPRATETKTSAASQDPCRTPTSFTTSPRSTGRPQSGASRRTMPMTSPRNWIRPSPGQGAISPSG